MELNVVVSVLVSVEEKVMEVVARLVDVDVLVMVVVRLDVLVYVVSVCVVVVSVTVSVSVVESKAVLRMDKVDGVKTRLVEKLVRVRVPVNVSTVNVLKVVIEVTVREVRTVVTMVLLGIVEVVAAEATIVVVRVNVVDSDVVDTVTTDDDVLVVVVVEVLVVVGGMKMVTAVEAVGMVGVGPPVVSHNTYDRLPVLLQATA